MIKTRADTFKFNRKGAVLVWAVVVLLLLTILIGSVLTLSMAYYIRCVNNHNARQAYYTARSAVDSIASVLCDTDSNENKEALLSKLSENGSKLDLNNLQFTQSALGSCSATINRESYNDSDTLLIIATAVVGKQRKSVSLRLKNHPAEKPSSINQLVIGDSTGSGTDNGITNYGFQTDANTDLYIGSNISKFEINITSNGNFPLLIGNVYCKAPFYIASDYYGRPTTTHVHGNIISDQLVALSDNATVGPFPNCCSGTQKESVVYTIASFTAINQAKIYSKVTAQTITLSNEVTAYNDMTGDTITLQDNVIYTGNITANHLIMKSQAKVTGNVTAGTVSMQDNAFITGNVNASSITIDSGGKIDGSVTAKNVTVTNSYQKPMITKNLTIQNNMIIQNNKVSTNQMVGGTITTGVVYTGSETPVAPLVSKVPAAPGSPTVPSPTGHPTENYNNLNQVLGKTDGSDSYYTISGNLNVSTMTTQGQGNIYIFVMPGANFTLNDMTPENKTNPHIFITVENGGTFQRENIEAENWCQKSMYKDFYGYIYGVDGSNIYIGRGTHIYGGISAKQATYGIDVAISAIQSTAISGGSGSTGTTSTGGTDTGTNSASYWTRMQYEPS